VLENIAEPILIDTKNAKKERLNMRVKNWIHDMIVDLTEQFQIYWHLGNIEICKSINNVNHYLNGVNSEDLNSKKEEA
jgi:hypothetical protein